MVIKAKFFFDFGSPNSYLSHLVIPDIGKRNNVTFEYIPILLGGIFKLTGNTSPIESLKGIKNKPQYNEIETQRFLKKYSITEYNVNPYFPVNTLTLMRGAVFAQTTAYYKRYVNCIFKNMWARPKKLDDLTKLKECLYEEGLPVDEIIAGTQCQSVKDELIFNTTNAVEKGVFGSPTFFVDNEIFFGKDKLDDVELEIKKRATEVAQV